MGVYLVLHLHRLDDAHDLPGLHLVAVRDLDREHGPLHRADDRILARPGRATCARALAAPARQLCIRWLGFEQSDLEALAVYLHDAKSGQSLGHVPCRDMSEDSPRHQPGLDDAVARPALDE